MKKCLTVSEIKYLNSHLGNGYFFSRNTMKFFKDKLKDFGTYLEDDKTILYHKTRGSKWVFDTNTNGLKAYTKNKGDSMDIVECNECHKEIAESEGVYSEISNKFFCDDKCFRDWYSGWADYQQTLNEGD